MKELNEKELDFVVRHYQANRLDEKQAWQTFSQKTGYAGRRGWNHRRWLAAASVTLLFGVAMAGGLWLVRHNQSNVEDGTSTAMAGQDYRIIQQKQDCIVLKYHNEPIGNVLSELSSYYKRNLTTAHGDRRISGEIEATSLDEVVEILEHTLDIEICVR